MRPVAYHVLCRIHIMWALVVYLLLCPPAWSAPCPQLTPPAARERMTVLSGEIRRHNLLYYQKNRPESSDAEYDRLFSELVLLEKCFPALASVDSPTRTVGSTESSTSAKIAHERPMLSLSSSMGPEAVEILLRKVASAGGGQLLVQPKVDGLPVELTYKAGRLVSAATRGNGLSGETVTETVRKIPGIPQTLTGSFPQRLVVRGEVYADRRLLSASGAAVASQYASPRHVAAGVLQARSPEPDSLALLRIFPFEVVMATGVKMASDREALRLLAEWGFAIAPEQTHVATNFAEVQAVFQSYLADREQLPFAVDGIVVKVDDLALRQRLGEGSRAPFWAAAWKFPPTTATTQVRAIRWQVGRTGRRTPVAEVAPVSLSGTLVRRVSLHTAGEVARLGIAVGDQVVVALAGDIIPQIVAVKGDASRSVASEPGLAAQPEIELDACLSDSPGCRDRFLSRAVYFAGKSGLNIAGLGKKRMKLLVEAGLVTDLPSLFRLDRNELAAVPGIGPKAAQKIVGSLRAMEKPEPFRLVAALGISGVGPATVRSLARHFASADTILALKEEDLQSLPADVASGALAVRSFCATPGGGDVVQKFRALGFW